MTRRLAQAASALLACAIGGSAGAQSFDVKGYFDLRVGRSDAREDNWLEGGLAKTRFGAGDGGVTGAAAIAADWQPTPSLFASAEVQYVPAARRPLDVIDAWVRWRPVSTTPWRWSAKAGMFFPPVSLENDGVGWTATRTLTPSAIDTWVGEELRVFGVEARLEHRGARGTLAASFALFGKNDPAGELLASRGWALHDVTSGLDGSVREPDAIAPLIGAQAPVRYRPFLELDHRLGAYASLDWRTPADDRAVLTVYDNRADPSREVDYAGRELYAWRTRFWSAGVQRRVGDVVFLAQAMRGGTVIEPEPGLRFDTRFAAAYVLAAWDAGRWQPALRVDAFQTRRSPVPLDEHGHAVTLALAWRPAEHWRLTGELLRVDSVRDQRRLAGLDPRQRELQLQASLRWFY
ncbi:MAG: hypothetical protein HOQ02_09795 [Lysobacter sp.]|nr:hypothetical protein [Lysobacter sp.]